MKKTNRPVKKPSKHKFNLKAASACASVFEPGHTCLLSIYIIGVPFPRSRARNLGSPAEVPAQKTIFYLDPFRSSLLVVSKTPAKGFREHLEPLLVSSGRSLALPKPVIPYSTSFKNRVFQVPSSEAPLDGTFEAIWSVWRRSELLLRALLGILFGTLTGGRSQEIRFCSACLPSFAYPWPKGTSLAVFGAFFDCFLGGV